MAEIGHTKQSIRQNIWDHLESQNLADFPRPVHHRIPNFKGSAAACERLRQLDIFKKANVIKVNPDKPQEHARFLALQANKTLLVPTPRLRSGLFNQIKPPSSQQAVLAKCSTSQGVRHHSVPLNVNSGIKIDVVIVGSVAVSCQGFRIGKGEGYADLEFAMATEMGEVTPKTTVISTVHDCQVMDLDPSLFGEHDLPVDIILTPTRTIECQRLPNDDRPPYRIIWKLLTDHKIQEIPILKQLRWHAENNGVDVSLKD